MPVYIRQTLTDLQHSFTAGLSSQHAIKHLKYLPPQLKCATTLPCEIQKIKLSEFLT